MKTPTGGVSLFRLAAQITVGSVIQMVISFTVLAVGIWAIHPHEANTVVARHAHYVAHMLAEDWDDDVKLAASLEEAAALTQTQLTLSWIHGQEDGEHRGPPRATAGVDQLAAGNRTVTVEEDVVHHGAKVGRLTMVQGFSPAPWSLPVFAGGVVLLVAGLTSLLGARNFLVRVKDLMRATQALGGGDLKARAVVFDSHVMGHLATTFNHMATRMENLVRAQSELLANVSHELRTPLARIRVALDLAQEGEVLDAHALSDISGDLHELESLVSEIITTARLEVQAGKAQGVLANLATQRVPVAEVIQASAGRFKQRFPGRELLVECPAQVGWVHASAALLRRAVDNLLENAARYSDLGTTIELKARANKGHTVIEVMDRGMGMAPEDLSRAFEPFYRSERSRNRAHGGLGLGLTLTQRIVEAHGGTVTLVSQLSLGTTARLEIPAAA